MFPRGGVRAAVFGRPVRRQPAAVGQLGREFEGSPDAAPASDSADADVRLIRREFRFHELADRCAVLRLRRRPPKLHQGRLPPDVACPARTPGMHAGSASGFGSGRPFRSPHLKSTLLLLPRHGGTGIRLAGAPASEVTLPAPPGGIAGCRPFAERSADDAIMEKHGYRSPRGPAAAGKMPEAGAWSWRSNNRKGMP